MKYLYVQNSGKYCDEELYDNLFVASEHLNRINIFTFEFFHFVFECKISEKIRSRKRLETEKIRSRRVIILS